MSFKVRLAAAFSRTKAVTALSATLLTSLTLWALLSGANYGKHVSAAGPFYLPFSSTNYQYLRGWVDCDPSHPWTGHCAHDLKGPSGSAIYAVATGVAHTHTDSYFTEDNQCLPGESWGRWVDIQHSNGTTTFYAHLSSYDQSINGQTVQAGQFIGVQGNAGCATTQHLHFEVHWTSGGTAVDPGNPQSCDIGSALWTTCPASPAPPAPTPTPTPPSCANASCFQQWLFRNGTGLGESGSSWVFKLADFDHDGRADLAGILMSQTGSGRTEVHVLSAASNYQQFIVHAATDLGETDANHWQFDFADWDHDSIPDLVGVLMNDSGSGTTELHILSGASGFSQRIYETGTALGESTASQWKFAVQDWNGDGVPDLIGVLMNQTGSGFTEVHILSGASNFQQWLVQDATPLGEAYATDWDFVLADIDRDGIPDLLGILTQNTSTFSTEIHAMSGSSHYHQWLMRTGTPLGKTDLNQFAFAAGDWNGDRAPDLFAILKFQTGTHMTELHVLSGVPSPHPPDTDGDGIIDDLDNCPAVANPNQTDTDADGQGDACDVCPSDPANDADNDGVCVGSGYLSPKTGDHDNCPTVNNPDQADANANGVGDACESSAPVGGIAELPDVAGAHAESSASNRRTIPVPAGVVVALAAGVVALGVGGWYARRRWVLGREREG